MIGEFRKPPLTWAWVQTLKETYLLDTFKELSKKESKPMCDQTDEKPKDARPELEKKGRTLEPTDPRAYQSNQDTKGGAVSGAGIRGTLEQGMTYGPVTNEERVAYHSLDVVQTMKTEAVRIAVFNLLNVIDASVPPNRAEQLKEMACSVMMQANRAIALRGR